LSPLHAPEELAGSQAPYHQVDIDPEAPALIQFTSGSTSTPRGAVLSHRAVLAEVAATASVTGVEAGSMVCSWLPLYHAFGLIGALLITLYGRAPLILMRPEQFLGNPLGWLAVISRH